ncbi:MAG TPA: MerR family transcriptional regulator [Clostridia bacterium]
MELLKSRYTITELSQFLGITDHALRYYEKEFNILVPKDERGRRYYTSDLANLMYRIKNFRNEGLEIKAIKKILTPEENCSGPIILDENSFVVQADDTRENDTQALIRSIKSELVGCFSGELATVSTHLSNEIYKTKQELGACIENSARKLETKMERHFKDVDESLLRWRKKNKTGPIKRFLKNVLHR